MTRPEPTPLERVEDALRFGGKASALGGALRAGLPVPRGFALDWELVAAVASGDGPARAACARALEALGARSVAARSSAIGEDSASASFAGVHLTELHVTSVDRLVRAIVEIDGSARSDAALAYRARLGIGGAPRMAVVVQAMIDAECAGVLFTRNPVDGADERVVEATWGLGEAVVAGIGEPDRVRMARGGRVLEAIVGDKDLAIRPRADGGGTEEVAIDPSRRRVACLDARRLAELESLASTCERLFPGAHDIEWAFEASRLHLLQRRAVTR